MGSGVTKSGSPMPNEITSGMVAAMSKKRRIPEGGTDATREEMKLRMTLLLVKTNHARVSHVEASRAAGQDRIPADE